MVKQLKNLNEFHETLKAAGCTLVVIDFTATWCGPCKFISPVFEKLSEELSNVIFCKVDVDDASDVSEHCKIQSMPTFVFYKNNNKIEQFSGANADKLKETIKRLS
ncbi:hypothetical protein GDO86_001315 [Hymenochirus boettgeri]|uniref:Thioredoxin n=1 Tax=Hymenochirus boettgeri TaxID=247094 RepID=A0A8T2KF95_9PIPI|nr:hypothetical protein GDO86_001315 [Hymenochirus boettgeri]